MSADIANQLRAQIPSSTDPKRLERMAAEASAKPRRVQLHRTKGWRMPPNTVKVARPGRWGNPFKVAPAVESQGVRIPEITVDDAVRLYREYIERAIATYPTMPAALEELRGKNLACWCRLDQPCHADVLLELANRPA